MTALVMPVGVARGQTTANCFPPETDYACWGKVSHEVDPFAVQMPEGQLRNGSVARLIRLISTLFF